MRTAVPKPLLNDIPLTLASQPQNVVLPLRLDVQVFSGIAPPPEVLTRMAQASSKLHNNPLSAKLQAEAQQHSDFGSNQIPQTPVEFGSSAAHAWPGQPESGPSAHDEDAPPSYEDAIANDAPPVVAPRPTYAPPAPIDDPMLGGDEEKGVH